MTDSQEKVIQKAESVNPKSVVPLTHERGQPRIVTADRFIRDSKKKELSPDNRLATFDAMLADADVFTAANYTRLFSVKALSRGVAVGKEGSDKSKEAAKFINYNLRNMGYGTWLQAVLDMTTAIYYGWSDLNIVLRKREYGKYKNNRCLHKLAPRDQKSVYGWLWNNDHTEWQGLVQMPSLKKRPLARYNSNLSDGLQALSTAKYYDDDYPIIRANQLLHISYNGSLGNPQGDSPLMHCYDAWYEKKLIENFEIGGISKDLSGVLIVKVPAELIEKAQDPETYPEAAEELAEIQRDAADMHQGKTTHILLTSDVDPTSKTPLYDIELKGVSGAGGGKSYITSDVIDQKRKAIFNVFGAGFLLLGQDGSGSYALSSSQTSVHGHIIERDIMFFVDAINTQLIPRLLAANDIFLDYEDMPEFQPAEPDEISIDDLGKVVQRMGAVNKLTPEIYKELLRKAKLPDDGVDDLDYTDEGQSRAADGMKSGMSNGTSKGGSKNDSSVSNSENGGSTSKSLKACSETDRVFNEDGICVNQDELNEEGFYNE